MRCTLAPIQIATSTFNWRHTCCVGGGILVVLAACLLRWRRHTCCVGGGILIVLAACLLCCDILYWRYACCVGGGMLVVLAASLLYVGGGILTCCVGGGICII